MLLKDAEIGRWYRCVGSGASACKYYFILYRREKSDDQHYFYYVQYAGNRSIARGGAWKVMPGGHHFAEARNWTLTKIREAPKKYRLLFMKGLVAKAL